MAMRSAIFSVFLCITTFMMVSTAWATSSAPAAPTESVCPICLAPLAQELVVYHDGCLHAFHQECLLQWHAYCETCPLCRFSSAPPNAPAFNHHRQLSIAAQILAELDERRFDWGPREALLFCAASCCWVYFLFSRPLCFP